MNVFLLHVTTGGYATTYPVPTCAIALLAGRDPSVKSVNNYLPAFKTE